MLFKIEIKMGFIFHKTELADVIIVEPKIFGDSRGFFLETYKASEFAANGIKINFFQDNHSKSSKGVIRGLHFQHFPKPQAKLVRCLHGKIFDVAVDLRPESKNFGKWFGVELSEENKKMLYIPEGFAHGFSVLSDEAEVLYKASNEYAPEYDAGVRWNDEKLNINWHVENPLVSDKDKILPTFNEYKKKLIRG